MPADTSPSRVVRAIDLRSTLINVKADKPELAQKILAFFYDVPLYSSYSVRPKQYGTLFFTFTHPTLTKASTNFHTKFKRNDKTFMSLIDFTVEGLNDNCYLALKESQTNELVNTFKIKLTNSEPTNKYEIKAWVLSDENLYQPSCLSLNCSIS